MEGDALNAHELAEIGRVGDEHGVLHRGEINSAGKVDELETDAVPSVATIGCPCIHLLEVLRVVAEQ